MSDKSTLSLLNAAFGKAGASLAFDARPIKTDKRYVAWIDIMGAGTVMRRSLIEGSSKIGQFNAAILNGFHSLQQQGVVTIHSMTDGAYVTAESAEDLRSVLSVIMIQLARYFLGASRENKFVVRCAVAFGEVVTSETMIAQLKQTQSSNRSDNYLLQNVMLGGPFAQAYAKEECAAPFGVYVDATAIGPDGFSSESVWQWWHPTNDDKELFIQEFRNCVVRYFQNLEEDYYHHMVPAAKTIEYMAKTKSYFKYDPNGARKAKMKYGPVASLESSSDESSEG